MTPAVIDRLPLAELRRFAHHQQTLIEAVVGVLADLEAQAEQMEGECLQPPCPHAWGIRWAVRQIRERALPIQSASPVEETP